MYKSPSRRPISIVALGCLFVLGSGCGSAGAPPKNAKGAPVALTPAEEAFKREAAEQHQAQVAWCDYLQELYKRAANGTTTWPRYAQCTEVTTLAAPKMLKQTADCSLAALKSFEGDPFTPEYAVKVSQCGSDAIDRMAVGPTEMAPFVATLCGRMTSCGQANFTECQSSLRSGIGPHFERVIGAMNSQGRTQLRSCLKTLTCDDMPSQVSACLEPLMDGLLWLPS